MEAKRIQKEAEMHKRNEGNDSLQDKRAKISFVLNSL